MRTARTTFSFSVGGITFCNRCAIVRLATCGACHERLTRVTLAD